MNKFESFSLKNKIITETYIRVLNTFITLKQPLIDWVAYQETIQKIKMCSKSNYIAFLINL